MTRAVLIGGPYDGARGDLRSTPKRVTVGKAGGDKECYERVDDPDTGEFLGGYCWLDPGAVADVWTDTYPSSDAARVGSVRRGTTWGDA